MALDTSPDADRSQTDILRTLGPARRLELACQLSETVRELARVRLRSRHPEWSDLEIREALLQELYGVQRDSR